MTDTANLSLPLIAAAQAQKHITHNEALERLDALVQLSVVDVLQTPPATPGDGDRYICAAVASGDWAGHDGEVAAWQGGGWVFYTPQPGWRAWVQSQSRLEAFDGAQWVVAGGGNSESVPQLGINASADASNRLTVSAPNTLLNHEGADHRLKINRANTADTASVVFQSGFSGRAEFGITGDDYFRLKVSPDGNTWIDALSVDPATGKTSLEMDSPPGLETGMLPEIGHSLDPLLFPYGFSGYASAGFTLQSGSWRFKIPFRVPREMTVSRIVCHVTTAGSATAVLQIGLRRWDRSAGWSFRELVLTSGEIDVSSTGLKDTAIAPQTVPAGWYVLDVACNEASVALLGSAWNYICEPAFGYRFSGNLALPTTVLASSTPYAPLPVDDLGATYFAPHFSLGHFCIGLG